MESSINLTQEENTVAVPIPMVQIRKKKNMKRNKNKKMRTMLYRTNVTCGVTITRNKWFQTNKILSVPVPVPLLPEPQKLPPPIPEGKIVPEINMATVSQDIWGKKRCLKSGNEYFPSIPKMLFASPKWIAVELRDIKQELNQTKSLLDNYPLNSWHKHTQLMNTAGQVMPIVRQEFQPEFCSQAWCKMYECLSTFSLIPEHITQPDVSARPPHFLSIHLCEAPGAFISATNHFLSTNYPTIQWDWLATTLNPHYEGNDIGTMINEDKLILSSLNNWIFLKDTTGNLMNRANLDSLIEQVKQKCLSLEHSVDLVTADGSIDCQTNPMEQESAVVELQFTEIIAALSILGFGGSFVLKIFTFLECQTISHLYILCSLFEEVHLFKPATSKEGNSEVYVICLKYRGRRVFRNQLDFLIERVGSKTSILSRRAIISNSLPFYGTFMSKILEAASFFTQHQIAVIKRNIKTWEDKSGLSLTYYQHDIMQRHVSWEWIDRYDVRSLHPKKSLFKLRYFPRHITHVDPRFEIGCHHDKLLLHQSTDLLVKMEQIKRQIEHYQTFESMSWDVSEISGSFSQLSPLVGRPYKNILSSRFCFGKILQMRSDLRAAIEPVWSLKHCKIWVAGRKQCDTTDTCITCNPESIRYHFSRVLTDLPQEDWEFSFLCCAESVSDILNYSDAQRTRKALRKMLLKISKLEINQSLFLCTFPLLSRIQLGFMYALNAIFNMVVLGSGGNMYGKEYPQGILLHRYKGINSIKDRNMILELVRIVNEMDKSDANRRGEAILEVVPAKNLIELANFNDILTYNLVNTANELSQIITETKDVMMQPKSDEPNSLTSTSILQP
ncbi:cap-specific mRNA (nucleoside-2'-O-)-methyltransferase 2-like [Folsomia candida]|nr:cap-specific mRNA (nucleoside-2'-O-)-methyltransferase 2-like [Folsomia candida]XP_035713408.1 cap-specific mRNA (nucleoside-2'-O-)-methyltransferase 2-like [Folsomia candida]